VVDLKEPFSTQTFEILSQTRKGLDVPVTTRHCLWTDSNENSVFLQGGRFFGSSLWNHSSYFLPKPKIPAYSIWRFDLQTTEWHNITGEVVMKANFLRAVGGAGASVPHLNQSFYIGFVLGCCSRSGGRKLTIAIVEFKPHAHRAPP
jgi:hypothetical protein